MLTRNFIIGWILTLIISAILAQSAAGGKIIYVDDDATGLNNGASWQDAYCFLQNALTSARSGDQIWVAKGVYKPDRGIPYPPGDRWAAFILKNGVSIYGGFPAGGGNWESRDPNIYETILSGDLAGNDAEVPDPCDLLYEPTRAENSYNVVRGSGTDKTAILDGFAIIGGNANKQEYPVYQYCGGGMYNWSGSPTVTNCIFSGNSAYNGGGVSNLSDSNPTLTNCTFSGNSAWDDGGGMCNWYSSPTVTSCTFSSNSAWDGGGMVNNGGSPTIINCTFSGNSADYGGGGMWNGESSPNIINCTFSANSADFGGGMWNADSSPTLTNCTFSVNSADYGGGGMYNEESGPTLTNCTFSGNSADYGGGTSNFWDSSPTLTNCTFSGNSAIRYGGGMCNWDSSLNVINCTFITNSTVWAGGGMYNEESSPTFTNCTFFGNSAYGFGGGICNFYGSPNVTNCTFSGNLAWDSGGGMWNNQSSPTVTNCIFSGNSAWSIGGGMTNYEGRPNVINCIFSGNSAIWYGGGMYNYDSGPTVKNCTFSGNSADEFGGAVLNIGMTNLMLINCILWGNTAIAGPQIAILPDSTVTVSYSSLQGGRADVFVGPGCTAIWNDGNIDADPLFIDADGPDNVSGTEDDNLRLLAGSPCVNGGDNSAIPPTAATDLDGNPRISDGTVDMGAYEGSHRGFNLSADSIRVPEGETATFAVALTVDPVGTVEVTIAVESGDPDITVESGGLLVFNSSNYSKPQTVTLAAGEDDDHLSGKTLILISAPGFVTRWVTATEADNEPYAGILFVDADAPGTNNGDSWKDAFTDLQQALSAARAAPEIKELWVAQGVYKPAGAFGDREATFQLIKGVAIRGGYAGLGQPDPYARDVNLYKTILSGDLAGNDVQVPDPCDLLNEPTRAENSYHVVTASGTDETAILDGFTITGGNANCYYSDKYFYFNNCGGGMYNRYGRHTINNCTFFANSAEYHGGGMFNQNSGLTINNCTFSGNSPDGAYLDNCSTEIISFIHIVSDKWWVLNWATLFGNGTLEIDSSSFLNLGGYSSISCNLAGPGTVQVDLEAELVIEGGAIVNLTDPCYPGQKGTIQCDGLLRVRDIAQIKNTNIKVTRASFEGDIGIFNSVITAEAGAPYGQFFIEDTATIIGNEIHADGDRYMDLDPSVFAGLIADNRIFVTITEGIGQTRGGLFELRGKPDLAGGGSCDPNNPFFCSASTIPDFDPNSWMIEELRLIDGAKVNLTNRFDLQAPFDTGGEDEVLYVRNLILGKEAILNTAFNRIYYQNLYADPCSIVKNEPFLGFSLNNIAFDDETEFITRIRHNNYIDTDHPEYNRIHVKRLEDLEPDPNGMMRMCNLQGYNARANGLFAKSGEDKILIRFEYLFETSDPNVEVIVYLTDSPELLSHNDPNRDDHYIEVGRLRRPPADRPGSAGSGRFGVFHRFARRDNLDFLRGTRIELELIGPGGSSILINNWDPQVHCNPLYCGDITGDWGATQIDYLTVLAYTGCLSELPMTGGSSLICFEFGFSDDGYVDVVDSLAWDWKLTLDNPHLCVLPIIAGSYLEGVAGEASGNGGKYLSNSGSYPLDSLVIAGKRGTNKLEDYHCIFDSDCNYVCSLSPSLTRAGGKLVADWQGGVYQVNISEGLVRLSDNKFLVPQGSITGIIEPRYNSNAQIRIGLSYEYEEWSGRPVLDAAFDADANYVYVVPVVVVPEANEPYEAAAKLHLLGSGYELVQIYTDVPPTGDNQYLDNLREIEIDNAGNLYVINADSLNESDILWIFDSKTGIVKQRLSLGNPTGNSYIPAPTALHVSQASGLLYLASSLQQQPDANSVLLYALSARANRIIKTIRINGMGHITGITEDPGTGTIWVVGFTMANIPEYIEPMGEPFYRPYLARIPQGAAGPVDAICLYDPVKYPDNDLALPVSILWTGIGEDKCPLADIDGSGRVNFADFALLAEHWLQSGCSYPDWCSGTDVTLDNKVNGDDLLAIIRCWLWTE